MRVSGQRRHRLAPLPLQNALALLCGGCCGLLRRALVCRRRIAHTPRVAEPVAAVDQAAAVVVELVAAGAGRDRCRVTCGQLADRVPL